MIIFWCRILFVLWRNYNGISVLQYKYAFRNIVSKRKGIAFIAMRFLVAQIQQFVFIYIYFLSEQKTLESVWLTKRSRFLNLQALCLLRRSFFFRFTNKSKIATAHKQIAKETNFFATGQSINQNINKILSLFHFLVLII